MVQEGFRLLIESSDGIVVSAITSFDEGYERSEDSPAPDVAVISLGPDDPVEIISNLCVEIRGLRVVVMVSREDLELQARALELGAVGIVNEDQNPALLIEAVKRTYAGETWLNQVLLDRIIRKDLPGSERNGERRSNVVPASGVESLTAREHEVLALIGTGLKNKQIAKRLHISEPTVRCHLSSIYGKLGVEDRLNLVIKAHRVGLLDLTQ